MQAPSRLAVTVCAVLCAACSGSGNKNQVTGPTPIPPASSLPASGQPVHIVSGADGTPVAGAKVLINDDEYYSGPLGQVELDPYSGAVSGDKVDVDAPGFLPRRTRLTSTRLVTLWPVASDEEAEAVHQMVYRRDGAVDQPLTPLYPSSPFYVSLLYGATPEIQAHWAATAKHFGTPFNLSYEVTTTFQYDPNEIAVHVGGESKCVPTAGLGFCRLDSPYEEYQIRADQALDPATVRRLLAYRFLGPNPLPGLMNPQAPADQLSEFEARTIRMILLRPLPNQWPDSDR